jgi:6-phosphogluconolactonase (cycloisomerase 2 family)
MSTKAQLEKENAALLATVASMYMKVQELSTMVKLYQYDKATEKMKQDQEEMSVPDTLPGMGNYV